MLNKNLYAVILAGGSGTRFWPLSRKSRPKQFLSLEGRQSLLKQTLQRISKKVPGQQILIVTNKDYSAPIIQQARVFKIPKKNILLEPSGKNTAPAICWVANEIYHRNQTAVMAVLPSDHLILNQQAFFKHWQRGVRLAQDGHLVTLGIVPTHPETGYGYLKTRRIRIKGKMVWQVERFTEKPILSKARQFLRSKRYFWNSGMFFWRCEVILAEFQKYLPKVYRLFQGRSDLSSLRKIWPKLPSISVDYGILEKAKDVVTIPAVDMGWSDLGSWASLYEALPKDQRGNIFQGDVVDYDSHGTLVFGDRRLITTVGLQDLIVVDTDDALLVCHRDHSQRIKDVVERLKSQKRKEH